jgi:tRNA threonylcarbamoyl adenosine modification protein YeaZ
LREKVYGRKESVCYGTKQGRKVQKRKKLEVCHLCNNLSQSARMNEKMTALIETSTPLGSVGVFDGAWRGAEFTSDRSHNCAIFGPWEEISGSISPGDIGCIVVGTGPGSYSGTRVGIAVAQGLAIAHGCSLVGLPSILATPMARSLPKCRAIGDARRGDWWWCEIEEGKCFTEPQMGSKEELMALIADGVTTFSLDEIPEEHLGRKILREQPTAELLWQAWEALTVEEKARVAAQVVQPVYLKPPHITMAKAGHPLLRGK